MTIKLIAAQEAIDRLRLLRPEAATTIAELLQDEMIEHPRAICTAYRKRGAQISREQKRRLGIRGNGFLSHAAFEELSELGIRKPLVAHETTLLRATFSLMRHNRVQNESELRNQLGPCFLGFEYDVFESECPACRSLHGSITCKAGAVVFPLPECTCVTANYDIHPKFDWLADLS